MVQGILQKIMAEYKATFGTMPEQVGDDALKALSVCVFDPAVANRGNDPGFTCARFPTTAK